MEVKNEVGEGGCDPAVQAGYDYIALAVSNKASGPVDTRYDVIRPETNLHWL